jgi:D-hexose-6-phosphate mutarotase
MQVYLHGAHVTSWKIDGQEQLYLSERAIFQEGKAIRGGIPVCMARPACIPHNETETERERDY